MNPKFQLDINPKLINQQQRRTTRRRNSNKKKKNGHQLSPKATALVLAAIAAITLLAKGDHLSSIASVQQAINLFEPKSSIVSLTLHDDVPNEANNNNDKAVAARNNTKANTKTEAATVPRDLLQDTAGPLKDFKRCLIPVPKQIGNPAAKIKGLAPFLSLDYQCTGEPYEQFAEYLLEPFIIQRVATAQDNANVNITRSPSWGRRNRLLPYRSDQTTRSILILGNSHTHQLVVTLLCQYSADIIQDNTTLLTYTYSMSAAATAQPQPQLQSQSQHPSSNQGSIVRVQLSNAITIFIATNCPVLYSSQWAERLERILGQSLNSLDGIVMSQYFDNEDGKSTQLQQQPSTTGTTNKAMFNIDFDSVRASPIRLSDLVQVYAGRIIAVSSLVANKGDAGMRYDCKENEEYQQICDTVNEKHQARDHCVALDGQRYIDSLKRYQQQQQQPIFTSNDATGINPFNTTWQVHECATTTGTQNEVSTCSNLDYLNTANNYYRFENGDGHRCTGARGGHVDLIAWDLVEILAEMLPPTPTTTAIALP